MLNKQPHRACKDRSTSLGILPWASKPLITKKASCYELLPNVSGLVSLATQREDNINKELVEVICVYVICLETEFHEYSNEV
jgi:hypothetical protein